MHFGRSDDSTDCDCGDVVNNGDDDDEDDKNEDSIDDVCENGDDNDGDVNDDCLSRKTARMEWYLCVFQHNKDNIEDVGVKMVMMILMIV